MARPRYHLLTSLTIARVLAFGSPSRPNWLDSLAGGFFVDIDHLVDYAIRRLWPSRRILILPIHSWEVATGLTVLALVRRRSWLTALVVSFAAHLLIDQFSSSSAHPLRYLIVYRLVRGFSADLFSSVTREDDWIKAPLHRIWRWF